MGKLTYVLQNERSLQKAHVLIDGTDVHATHPRGGAQLLSFKTQSDKDALAKFQDVIKQYFHPRDGWRLDEKKPGVALYPELPKPPSPEEVAAADEAARARKLGYAIDGTMMVLDIKRQRTVGDLEIALERAAGIEDLWVLTALDDEDGRSASTLFSRLENAAPKLRALSVDCPWDTLTRAAAAPLPGLGALLDKRRGLERLSVTGQAVWSRPLAHPELTSLALCADPLDPEALTRITKKALPALKRLALGLSVEHELEEEAPEVLARVAAIPLAQLEVLTITGASDLTALVGALLDAQKGLPARVELDGSIDDTDALLDALKRWRKETKTPVHVGEQARGLLDEDAETALDALAGEAFASPFDPQSQDPRAQALWKKIA